MININTPTIPKWWYTFCNLADPIHGTSDDNVTEYDTDTINSYLNNVYGARVDDEWTTITFNDLQQELIFYLRHIR